MMGGRCATCLVPVLSSILICNLVTCESSMQRTDYKTGEVTVCRRINCTSGSYVKVCTKNGTADRCEPCPSGTYQPDNTSSDLPKPCGRHGCPLGSVPADSYPESGCPKKCRCDPSQKKVGLDPCGCLTSNVTCPSGSQLTIYNNCTAIAPPLGPPSSLITTRGPTVSSTPHRTAGLGRGTVTMVTLTSDSSIDTSDSPIDTSDSLSDSGTNTDTVIYVVIVAGVLLVILVVAAVVLVVKCYRKRRSRPYNGPDMNEMELQERNPLRDTSNMASNENGTGEHNSTGMPQCHSETEATDRMGTGEATQNGYINTPPLDEIPSQEINNETMYIEESERKELYREHNHQTYGGERIIDLSPFTSSEQMSNNAAALGSTIGLPSASTLDPDSITKEDEYPDSIKLNAAPLLDIKQLHENN